MSNLNNNSEKVAYFQARLKAQLVVICISLTLTAQRLAFVLSGPKVTGKAAKLLITTIPFLIAMCAIVIFKYVLFRKIHARILRYTNYIDLVFCLVFTAEWLVSINAQLSLVTIVPYNVAPVITFGTLGWRTLLQLLVSPHWKIRIIGPLAVWIYIIQYAVRTNIGSDVFPVIFGVSQILFIILIFYFEHKINFTLTLGNIHQEQWLRLNEFMLNNIPENIAIMDLKGKCRFISQNLQKTINRRVPQDDEIEQFFLKIKDIQCLPQEPESDSETSIVINLLLIFCPNLEKDLLSLETRNPSSTSNCDRRFDTTNIDSLGCLIKSFSSQITRGTIRERTHYIFDSKFKQEDNSLEERSFQINISFLNQNPDKYVLLILRDTTQRDLVLTLQGNMKYKDHLLASVSHELRTPLNGNINLLEAAIRSTDISENIKEALLIPAVKSSKFLLHLVNDILDLYQIKAQKLRLVFQRSSLKETLINTLQLLELHTKRKGIKLEMDIDLKIPDNFCTDHARLSQIILNLMSNSIKFTQQGFVKLSACALRDSDDIKISVEDSGLGMTKQDIGKLFKDFTHIESRDREKLNPTGVGLGLKIANDLAQLLGSEGNKGIVVESVLNQGSTFSFVIDNKETGLESQRNAEPKEEPKEDASPLVPNEFNVATEASLELKLARVTSIGSQNRMTAEIYPMATLSISCSCPQILVVDDDSFNIMAYEVILNSCGARYECVYNGRSAIDKMLNKVRYPCSLHCHPYKIVFMDEEMPGMNGRETVTEICSMQKQGLLPQMDIIGCTAHHDKEHIDEFLKSGIVEYMPKPISFDTIKRVLKKYGVLFSPD